MSIVNLTFYRIRKEVLELIYKDFNVSKITRFCEDNGYDVFRVSGDCKTVYYKVSKKDKDESVPRFSIDFYKEAGNNTDVVHTLIFRESDPLYFKRLCYDNFFYKFQIKNKDQISPFYYSGTMVENDYDGITKRISINYPECTRFLAFGYLRLGLTDDDIALEELLKKTKRPVMFNNTKKTHR